MVAEREKEIEDFQKENYYTLTALVRKMDTPSSSFSLKMTRINKEQVGVKERRILPGTIKTKEQLETIKKELIASSMVVDNVVSKVTSRRPHPPFMTSSLLQAASGSLGFSVARTIIAQKLYETS